MKKKRKLTGRGLKKRHVIFISDDIWNFIEREAQKLKTSRSEVIRHKLYMKYLK